MRALILALALAGCAAPQTNLRLETLKTAEVAYAGVTRALPRQDMPDGLVAHEALAYDALVYLRERETAKDAEFADALVFVNRTLIDLLPYTKKEDVPDVQAPHHH